MAKKKQCVGTYSGEEIFAVFTETFEWEPGDRVGVPGAWLPAGNVKLSNLEILAVETSISDLPEVLQAAIWALADEVDWRDEDA